MHNQAECTLNVQMFGHHMQLADRSLSTLNVNLLLLRAEALVIWQNVTYHKKEKEEKKLYILVTLRTLSTACEGF